MRNDTDVEIRIHFKYDGGSATDGYLDIYDASVALRGISRSIVIFTHAFLNDGEVRQRADHAQGAKIYLHPPVRGSFDQLVTVVIAHREELALSVLSAALHASNAR
jgi:hypothetical protein